ncbi:hypothetical protein LA6_003757 [Marinibacterium anthonyi]|nr:hypothetical protein LA6_003757 [Marinibacterium anthonyi]
MKFAICLCAATLAFAAPALAQDKMFGPGGSTIYRVDQNVFEVVATGGGKAMWCGASKFARKSMKAGWKDNIVVVRGSEPSSFEDGRRPGVRFTLDPQAAGVVAGALSWELQPGAYMTVSFANKDCARLDNPSNR